jgi:hypothetical protein
MLKKFRNCPIVYYDRCENAQSKCHVCCAGTGPRAARLHWESIDSDYPDHPFRRDVAKQKRLREAKAAEKTSRDLVARATLGSGNKNHDGDNLLLGHIREEVKLRGPKGTLGVTRAEWKKGKEQGIEIFSIHFEDESRKAQRLFCLTESLYSEMLTLYNQHQHRHQSHDQQ